MLFFFNLVALWSYAQSSFPNSSSNPVWIEYNYQTILGPSDTPFRDAYRLGRDKIICGKTYQEIILYQESYNETKIIGFVRNQGQKVYIRQNEDCNKREHLVYDFSLKVGDTVYCAFDYLIPRTLGSDSTKFWVQSIDSIKCEGVLRKRLKMRHYMNWEIRTPSTDTMTRTLDWIEGIGTPTGGFYPFHCESSFCNEESILICFHNKGQLQYSYLFMNARCSPTLSNEESKVQTLKAFPTLTSSNVKIELPEDVQLKVFSIVNVMGKIVQQRCVDVYGNLTIDASHLSSGVYFLQAQDAQSKRYIAKFVKQ